MSAYAFLEEKSKKINTIKDILGILNWDASTMMPTGAASLRGEQSSMLNLMIQQIIKDSGFAEALENASSQNLTAEQKANLNELKRYYIHQNAIEDNLLKEYTELTNETDMVWREARPQNNFKMLLPNLKKIFDLARQMGEAKAEKLGCTPYEALVDEFDPGSNCKKIDLIFNDLETFLPDFLQKVLHKQENEPKPIALQGPFPIERQKELGLKIMDFLGFDKNFGRLDISTHPFCGGSTNDVRITTRYDENDFVSALYGVIHETGHALYEQGLPDAWSAQLAGQARGMGLHESQSLFYEKQIGRNPHFVSFLAPHLKQIFEGKGPAWDVDNLIRLNRQVQPSFIRVEADEVTYPLHIIMRYKIEKGLIDGTYNIADLPDIWDNFMVKYLGIKPDSLSNGCLQDIHWPVGLIGYFPSYTMGSLIAAQLFASLRDQNANVEKEIEQGQFKPTLEWLRKNIHEKASFLSQDEILIKATKQPLSANAFKTHLQKRYLNA
ncbi:MAG: carboxypeptidase M32 [Alphaproteobacteria bacterium]|nr:carboxypeptidase M32 [Alphaproteobacteria bacterium]